MPGRWRHVIVNTHCSWLHGDRRGFRSRGHRIHSSGDYAAPPPANEHAGLRAFHETLSADAVSFDPSTRVAVIRAFVTKMRSTGFQLIACSCGEQHLHALAELPLDFEEAKRVVGRCKQRASHAIRDVLPGTVWSAGCELTDVRDADHLQNAYGYIRTKQEPGTVVWSHRAEEDWVSDSSIGWWVITAVRTLERVPPDATV